MLAQDTKALPASGYEVHATIFQAHKRFYLRHRADRVWFLLQRLTIRVRQHYAERLLLFIALIDHLAVTRLKNM